MITYDKLFIGGQWVVPSSTAVYELNGKHRGTDRLCATGSRGRHRPCGDVYSMMPADRTAELHDDGEWTCTAIVGNGAGRFACSVEWEIVC
jgi:hypothetical protein